VQVRNLWRIWSGKGSFGRFYDIYFFLLFDIPIIWYFGISSSDWRRRGKGGSRGGSRRNAGEVR